MARALERGNGGINDDERRTRAASLRAQLAAADRSGAGKPFPERLRRQVVEYGRAAISQGGSFEAAARELGISAMSIKRWLQRIGDQAAPGAELRRVEIVPDRCEVGMVVAAAPTT